MSTPMRNPFYKEGDPPSSKNVTYFSATAIPGGGNSSLNSVSAFNTSSSPSLGPAQPSEPSSFKPTGSFSFKTNTRANPLAFGLLKENSAVETVNKAAVEQNQENKAWTPAPMLSKLVIKQAEVMDKNLPPLDVVAESEMNRRLAERERRRKYRGQLCEEPE